MSARWTRRRFAGQSAAAMAAAVAVSQDARAAPKREFRISLVTWSLHRAIRANFFKQIDCPAIARTMFGVDAIELVDSLFESPMYGYLKNMKQRADDQGVKILQILVSGEGALAHADPRERKQALRNHRKWVDIADVLGCRFVRANLHTGEEKTPRDAAPVNDDVIERGIESFSQLVEYAKGSHLSILVENHGGVSSNADALVRLIKGVNSPNFGSLPDFGNFPDSANPYEEVRKLMPFAKAVSAKCYDFDKRGNETRLDYNRLIPIVVDEGGYHGYIGIEYEGLKMPEYEAVVACKRLLERLRQG